MARFRMKKNWQIVIAALLTSVLTFGLVAALVSLTSQKADEGKVIVNLDYEIGEINQQTGSYVPDSDGAIYSEAFKCRGLKTTLNFENDVKYRIYFYTDNNVFISCTSIINGSYPLDGQSMPENAVYARIEITPLFADVEKEEDKVVKWYSVNKYAKQLIVQVDAEQEPEEVEDEETTSDLTT